MRALKENMINPVLLNLLLTCRRFGIDPARGMLAALADRPPSEQEMAETAKDLRQLVQLFREGLACTVEASPQAETNTEADLAPVNGSQVCRPRKSKNYGGDMPARKFTEAQAEQALLACYGNVSAAARALGVKHSTLFYRLKKSARLQEARILAEEQALDVAEDSLLKAVKKGEAWAVCFLLKTRGKRRGYVERQEVATPADNPFSVSILGPVMGGGAVMGSGADPDRLAPDMAH